VKFKINFAKGNFFRVKNQNNQSQLLRQQFFKFC